ncbi:hypothetical protein RISK_001649 [Rhodopirellula islandica]|uniref:Uncharacterized protein n=1 Tax=Rhodopirellula islandica TaxID=595434 RepID=A0A0J1BJ25_RHOIS|nr:hypothetical protein RISK_001649 [Rhodopirellula islandica]
MLNSPAFARAVPVDRSLPPSSWQRFTDRHAQERHAIR